MLESAAEVIKQEAIEDVDMDTEMEVEEEKVEAGSTSYTTLNNLHPLCTPYSIGCCFGAALLLPSCLVALLLIHYPLPSVITLFRTVTNLFCTVGGDDGWSLLKTAATVNKQRVAEADTSTRQLQAEGAEAAEARMAEAAAIAAAAASAAASEADASAASAAAAAEVKVEVEVKEEDVKMEEIPIQTEVHTLSLSYPSNTMPLVKLH
jgi:hypothetical protein